MLAFEADPPARIASRLPTGALVGELDGTPVAVIPDPEGPRRKAATAKAVAEGRGGLGNPVPWAQAPESARRALLALGLAGDGAMVDSSERILDLLLAGERALAADLRTRALAPLEATLWERPDADALNSLAWKRPRIVVRFAWFSTRVPNHARAGFHWPRALSWNSMSGSPSSNAVFGIRWAPG